MISEERKLILSLVIYSGSGREGSPEAVLRHFGTDDGSALGLCLLRDALDRRDGIDVELALIVGAAFGVTEDYLELLVLLSAADWHQSHEDIVSASANLRTPRAVETLYQATQWVPEYLDYDVSRALATKAIWGLARTPGSEAREALTRLLDSGDDIVKEQAEARLGGRR